MLYLLLLGILLLTTGFIIIYKGPFASSYTGLIYIFFCLIYLIIWSVDKIQYKILSLILISIAGFLRDYLQSKTSFIIFNIKTHNLLDILITILNSQNISFQTTNNSIQLDCSDKKTIKIKSYILNLNILSLLDIDDTDLNTTIENELDIALSQIPHKKNSSLGILMFAIGLVSIVMFYSSIIS